MRFFSRSDRDRVLKIRKNLKDYNEDKDTKLYINEDLTAIRAKLFSTARSLQKQRLLVQTWTSNGTIKVKTPEGVVHTATTSAQLKQLVPDADPRLFLWIQLPLTSNMYSLIAPFIWQTIMEYTLYDLFWRHGLCNINSCCNVFFSAGITHCGLMTLYGRIDWGQRWIKQWLVAWRHQAIAWAKVELLLESFSGLQITENNIKESAQSTILYNEFKNRTRIYFHIIPGANELIHDLDFVYLMVIYGLCAWVKADLTETIRRYSACMHYQILISNGYHYECSSLQNSVQNM